VEKERDFIGIEMGHSADALARRFVQRWDLHARQVEDGRYICIQKPLTQEHLFAHLRGEITLGTYVLSKKNLARFIVFDADDESGFKRLAHLAVSIGKEQVPSYLEASRRGGHLWMFFSKAIRSREARSFGKKLLLKHRVENVELFPKQDQLVNGPGSLIRMPFGIHKLSGQRYGFFYPDGSPIASALGEQIHMLSAPQVVTDEAFESVMAYQTPISPSTPYRRPGESREPLSERIKESISVLDFISKYVELTPTGNGAIGHCPFHEDQHPSFGVNIEENYWHCFAGCGGGSVIDFWSKMREKQGLDPGFLATIMELSNLLMQI
jgi:hypothetical protein